MATRREPRNVFESVLRQSKTQTFSYPDWTPQGTAERTNVLPGRDRADVYRQRLEAGLDMWNAEDRNSYDDPP